MPAEQTAAVALLESARQAGVAVPRALLDAAAHRNIAAQQHWGTTQTRPPAVRAGAPHCGRSHPHTGKDRAFSSRP